MVCIRIVWWIFWRGIASGALLGALFGTFLAPLIGTVYGFLFGALIGTIMGAVDAFVLGAVSHFFMDLAYPSRIIPWLRLIGVTVTLIGVGIYAYLFFGATFATLIPPVLAAIVVYLLCPRFVTYAVNVQQTNDHPITKQIVTS